MPPSDGDLNAALANGYKKGYTIGHNGVILNILHQNIKFLNPPI